MAHEVFVSYSTADKPVADAVCATLERHGVRCWIAPRDILPGLDWGAAIVDAIGASKVMVLVFSAAANKSPQIKREVERAVHKGVAIIPLRIEDVPLGKTLEYFISSSHWLDAYTPSVEAHLDRLAETVKLLLARPSRASETGVGIVRPAAAPPPAQPPSSSSPGISAPAIPAIPSARPSGVSTRALGIVAVAALLVGGGAFLATRGHSPKIESIEFPQAIVQGQKGNGVIHFSDKKGDAALVKFEPVQGASFRTLTMALEGMTGRTSGNYGFWLSSPLVEHVVLDAVLVDNDGKKSKPYRFGFDIRPAPAPPPPPRPSPRGGKKSFEIQAPNGFKFKVN
ncbi:MAG TPA: toll/interleukin-1 receptor domain-containing protein [Thermoanaerobaculia bacterium]